MTNRELYDYCLDRRENSASWVEIHKDLSKAGIISKTTDVESLIKHFRELVVKHTMNNGIIDESFDEKLEKFFDWIGKTRSNVKEAPQIKNIGVEKTVSISDIHIPYHDKNKIMRVIDEHGGNTHRLVINGDFLNGTQISDHPKNIWEDFRQECSEGRVVLELLCSVFPEVVLTDDNHIHSRWKRLIAKQMRADVAFLCQHPYDFLTAGLNNVKRAKVTHATDHKEELGWIYRQGDAFFAHAELSTTDEFRTAKRLKEWIQKWRPVFDWPEPRFVCQAHTHNSGTLHESDSMLVLNGCLLSLDAVTYSMGPECRGKPPIHGYAVLIQKDGVTDLESSYSVRLPLK